MIKIVSAKDLKGEYNQDFLVKVEEIMTTFKKSLNSFLIHRNTHKTNSVVLAFCEDYRKGGKVLHTNPDGTSPYLEIDLGLTKNGYYSLSLDMQAAVKPLMEVEIQGMVDLGYSVESYWGYLRHFIPETTPSGSIQVHESFIPVRCFKVSWTNE